MLDQLGGYGQVLRDGIVEREFALFDQHHDGHGGELFSHRAGLKDRLWRHADAVLQVGHAVTCRKHYLAVVADHDGTSGDLLFLQIAVYEVADAIRSPGERDQREEACEKQRYLNPFHP